MPTKRKLKHHLKHSHNPEEVGICERCGKEFRNKKSIYSHMKKMHAEIPRPVPVPAQCKICDAWLKHSSGLKRHMKTMHENTTGEHRCHICNKTSSNERALQRHITYNHEIERKFKCHLCDKAFKRKQDLREHTSVHTGEVLYACPNCPMTFFSYANMHHHRQRFHRSEWETERKRQFGPPNIMRQAADAAARMQMIKTPTSVMIAERLKAKKSD